MEPVSGTGVVVIGLIVVVVGFSLWLVLKHSCRLVVSNPGQRRRASVPISRISQRKWA
ncbi:MAG: hypothetical protein R3E92_02395 [Burkholderiaceae bacterium]